MLSFSNVNAQSLTAKVLRVGCHLTDNQCFVFVDKEIPNSGSCENNVAFRYDSEEIHNSEELYSSLLAAQASGRNVIFGGAGKFVLAVQALQRLHGLLFSLIK